MKTIKAVFPSIYLCHTSGQNTIIIGTREGLMTPAEIREKAKFIQDYYQFSFPLVDRANELKIPDELPNLDLEKVSILHDNVSPGNYFDSWLF